MKFKKYVFRDYSPKYIMLFDKEKRKLKKILPKNCRIEHVGSTSVKNLGGKGVIDILVGTKDKKGIIQIKKLLEKNKYKSAEVRGRRDKLSFERDYGIFIRRKVHIHITFVNSPTWKEYILTRNFLRKNSEIAKEYEKIKKEALKFTKQNGKKYQNYKRKFLNKIKRKVLKK